MKSKNNGKFMFVILAVIIAIMGLLAFITSSQEKEKEVGLPTVKEINDAKPSKEIKDLDLENQPMLGKEDAPVEIVVFGDFKCPACKQWELTSMVKIKEEYIDTGKAKLYFINYAFLGRDSYLAAVAGESIYKQNNDAFWDFYKLIYEKQGSEASTWANQAFIQKLVKDNIKGIDFAQFKKDIENYTELLDEVVYDKKIGEYYNISATPSVLVNEVKVESDYNSVVLAIESALSGDKK